MVTTLLERGANPNTLMPGQRGSVGLFLLDNPGLVSAELLNKLKIDPDFKLQGSAAMLGYALAIGEPEMVSRYLSKGASMQSVDIGTIFSACAIDLPFDRYERMVSHVIGETTDDSRFLHCCLLGAQRGNHVDRVQHLRKLGAKAEDYP